MFDDVSDRIHPLSWVRSFGTCPARGRAEPGGARRACRDVAHDDLGLRARPKVADARNRVSPAGHRRLRVDRRTEGHVHRSLPSTGTTGLRRRSALATPARGSLRRGDVAARTELVDTRRRVRSRRPPPTCPLLRNRTARRLPRGSAPFRRWSTSRRRVGRPRPAARAPNHMAARHRRGPAVRGLTDFQIEVARMFFGLRPRTEIGRTGRERTGNTAHQRSTTVTRKPALTRGATL
jgi:hypothetical protein